ncbi:MAG: hypothetical protein ACRED0_02375 [Gammaproteobacteria bacterium]
MFPGVLASGVGTGQGGLSARGDEPDGGGFIGFGSQAIWSRSNSRAGERGGARDAGEQGREIGVLVGNVARKLGFDILQLPRQSLDDCLDAAAGHRVAGGQAVALRDPHRDQLAPPRHQRLRLPLFGVGQRLHKLLPIGMAVKHPSELGQGQGIDAVGLGEMGEIPGLARIDDGQGLAGPLHGQSGTALIAPVASRTMSATVCPLFKARAQRFKALCIVHQGLDSPAGTQGDFQGPLVTSIPT